MLVTQAGGDRLLRIAVAAPQSKLITQEARRQLFMLGWNGIAPAAKEPVVARLAGAIKVNVVLALAATAENANVPLLVPASFAEQGIWSPRQRRALCTQEKLDTASLFRAIMSTDGRFAILLAVMAAVFFFHSSSSENTDGRDQIRVLPRWCGSGTTSPTFFAVQVSPSSRTPSKWAHLRQH